jgi:NADH:ubiquinone reductase (non-electrogenic)
VKKPKRFRFFRFIWRATWVSAIGGTAYLAYGVWELRHPEEQLEPDPSKKNLVILGIYFSIDPFEIISNCFS